MLTTRRNMKNIKINFTNILTLSLLLFLICLTRISHELTAFSLPDASLIILFAAGILLRKTRFLIILLLGIIFLDNFAIYSYSYEKISLFNSGYYIHLASYIFVWLVAHQMRSLNLAIFSTRSFLVISIGFVLSYVSYFYLQNIGSLNSLSIWAFLSNNIYSYFLSNGLYAAILYVLLKAHESLSSSSNGLFAK